MAHHTAAAFLQERAFHKAITYLPPQTTGRRAAPTTAPLAITNAARNQKTRRVLFLQGKRQNDLVGRRLRSIRECRSVLEVERHTVGEFVARHKGLGRVVEAESVDAGEIVVEDHGVVRLFNSNSLFLCRVGDGVVPDDVQARASVPVRRGLRKRRKGVRRAEKRMTRGEITYRGTKKE